MALASKELPSNASDTPVGYEDEDWDPATFARLLREKRGGARLSRYELANAIGISPSAVQHWENARVVKAPGRGMVMAIEDAVGATDGALLAACRYLPRLDAGSKWSTEPGNLEAPIIHVM